MNRTLLQSLIICFCIGLPFIGFSQQGEKEQCAAHLRHETLLNSDPIYRKNHKRAELQIQDALNQMQSLNGNGAQAQIFGDTLEIPVVVHIIHTGQNVGVGANIADSQIFDAIEVLNDRYRKTPNTHGDANGVDTEIQFVLAERDPDCNATTGIVRVNGSSVTDYSSEGITAGQGSGANELDVKSLSRWPATDYLNIWVVTEIEDNGGGFGIQGYAYFPGVSAAYDGVVIMHTCFGTIGTVNSWNNLNRTLTHEVGHYLDLYHTFEGDNSGNNCPSTTNGCGSGSGDCCADTEPHIRASSNCPTGTNSCTSTSWNDVQHNYMNYSSQTCADMFTEDQSDRMRAALMGPRHSLLTSLGTEPPTTNTVAAADCIPETSNLNNSFGMGVFNVTFETIDVTSDGAVADSGYRDFTCHQMAEVFPSTSYNISVYTGGTNSQDVRVYVDYNDDGDFEDSNEEVFSNDTDTLHTGSFTIPSNPTMNTPLRMRVISDWQGNTTALNAGESCYDPQYGQAEDYTIFVKGSMTASISGSDVSCNGGSDGSITVTVSSGTANYNYSWSSGAATNNSSSASNTVTGLAAGTYTVTVTDANSNTVSASYTIGEPSSPVSASISLSQTVSCFGGSDGQLTASGSGGTGAFTYIWNTGATTATATGLVAGTYSVTVTDANGCTDSTSSGITGPSAALNVSLSVDNNASCGSANGSISSTVTGGTTAYTYLWSTGSLMSSISNLSAGTYSVTVTDANSCTTNSSATVGSSGAVSASITITTAVSCGGGATGALTASASGGSGTISYAWNTGASTALISGLTAGTYSVTATDTSGCSGSDTITLGAGSNMTASVTLDSAVTCNGGSDGVMSASQTGGSTPLTYSWSNGASTSTITGLSAGTYTVTITENGGCTATASGTVTEPTAIVASASTTNVSCNGGNDGSIVISISGGTPPYTYAWSNGGSANSITNLSAGSYGITITDANGCTHIDNITLTQPSTSVVASISIDSNAGCGGSSLGGLTASGSGGTGSMTFIWSNGANTASITGLSAGTYSVTVTDANGCNDAESATITGSGSTINTSSTLSICNGDSVLVHGMMVSQTGTYVDTLTSAGGCDSISTVTVVNGIGSYNFTLEWIYQGDSIFLAGAFQTQSNIYLDTFQNSAGCDSLVETLLWVYPVQIGTNTITICQNDSVLLGGMYRSTAGTYTDTTFISGTAHINTTTLVVNTPQQVNTSMTIVAGDSVYLAGAWRTSSGTYCDTVGACDTVYCVSLTVNVVTYVTIMDAAVICAGDSIFLGGASQTTGGTYIDTIGNNFGKDTILITTLTVDQNSSQIFSSGFFLKSLQLTPPFMWLDCDSGIVIATTTESYYQPGYSGNFAVINLSTSCNDTSNCVFHANTANKTNLDVRGYPTAAYDRYSIQFSATQSLVNIDLYDLHGQLIQRWSEREVDFIQLPLERVAAGYYLVRISSNEGQGTLKFAKMLE